MTASTENPTDPLREALAEGVRLVGLLARGAMIEDVQAFRTKAEAALAVPVVPERGQDGLLARLDETLLDGPGGEAEAALVYAGMEIERLSPNDPTPSCLRSMADVLGAARVVPARPPVPTAGRPEDARDLVRRLLDEAEPDAHKEAPRADADWGSRTGGVLDCPWCAAREFLDAAVPARPLDDTEALREFAEFVVRLDDLDGPGYVARRTITMHKLIEKAKAALAASPHGLDDTEVERAAKAIAEADGWDWHDDDYDPPDPKWQATDKAEYRRTARAALAAARSHDGQEGAREAEPTPDAWQLTPQDADHLVDALGEVYGHAQPPDGWNEKAKARFLTAAAKLYALSVRPGPGEDERP